MGGKVVKGAELVIHALLCYLSHCTKRTGMPAFKPFT